MFILNSIKITVKNLMAAKFRSFLTILGVIIGVAAVIIIFSIGKSAQKLIVDQIKGVGSNLIAVIPGASSEEGPPAAMMGIVTTTLTYDDLNAIRDSNQLKEIESGAGYVLGTENVSWEGSNRAVSFMGTTASYLDVENTSIMKGRFLNEGEEKSIAKVAILGSATAVNLFGENDPLGKKIKIKGHAFTVIGVLNERGSGGFGSMGMDEYVFVSLKTAQKLLLGINHLGLARFKAKDAQSVDLAKAKIAMILRDRHNVGSLEENDFSVRDQESALEVVTKVTDVLRYFLLAVGSISLIVGGVGIMNIMLISLNQRIREIGLRKAIGAKRSDITFQFLIESVFIALIGGVIGIILGVLISFIVGLVINKLGYSWELFISFPAILTAVLVTLGVGIIFGVYPARKAANVSPMEALRYE